MERRFPIIEVELDCAAALLAPLGWSDHPCDLDLLAGGHINTNYVVTLDSGRRVVLRLFCNGEPAFRKEVALLSSLAGSVAVPRVHLAVFESSPVGTPYAVLEWVDGMPLGSTLAGRPGEASAIGETVAETLVAISRHRLPTWPRVPFVDHVRRCIFEAGAAQWLGVETAKQLWAVIQERSYLLEPFADHDGLIHGDFQGDNLLLRGAAGQWQVAAVLDWEWAYSGSHLQDLGNLLRARGAWSRDLERGLELGFARARAPLPDGWQAAARLWDLAALCEKLAYPRHRGEVTVRVLRLVEGYLRDHGA